MPFNFQAGRPGRQRQKKLDQYWEKARPDLLQAIEHIRAGMSRPDASEAVGRKRGWLAGYMSRSEGGNAPSWIWRKVREAEAEARERNEASCTT